jgi:hypothetical protein
MPQPKKSSAPPDDPRSTLALLRDFLLLPSDRVRETLDDAVRRGRITRADAEELVDRFTELGRKQTDDLLSRLGAVPGGAVVGRAVRGATRRSGDNAFPIPDYDDLTAAQIIGKLGDLDVAQLREVRDYEKRNANRKSVLAAVDKRLS